MRAVAAHDDQDDQEALRLMSDTLIDVRQSAVDRNLEFLAYLVEMAIVELGEIQGHSIEGVTPLDEQQPAKPATLLDADSTVFAKKIAR